MILKMPFRHQMVPCNCYLAGAVMRQHSRVSQFLAFFTGDYRMAFQRTVTKVPVPLAFYWRSCCLVHVDLIRYVSRCVVCNSQVAGSLGENCHMHTC